MTAEARALFDQWYPGVDPEEHISNLGVCDQCKKLPATERKELADKAVKRTLDEMQRDALRETERPKYALRAASKYTIDLTKTIEAVTFPPEIWEWLDLLGYAILFVQAEATSHDRYFADTDYTQLLVRAINRDISSLNAIYTLLRVELIHQAAAHVRLFCEGVITLRYIADDVTTRLPQFLDYAHIEAFEIVQSVLEQERHRAKPTHVLRLEQVANELRLSIDHVKPRYTFTDRNGKQRPFRNWCNLSVDEQARRCGTNFVRLYDRSYIHN